MLLKLRLLKLAIMITLVQDIIFPKDLQQFPGQIKIDSIVLEALLHLMIIKPSEMQHISLTKV
jgi:hypothetical protein